MGARVQSKVVPRCERTALDNDCWVWGVILTTAALTALCVATLFTVATN